MTYQGPTAIPKFEDDFAKEIDDINFHQKTFICYNGIEYAIIKENIYLEQKDDEKLPIETIVLEAVPVIECLREPTEEERKNIQEEAKAFEMEMIKQQQSKIVTPGQMQQPNVVNFPGQK